MDQSPAARELEAVDKYPRSTFTLWSV